MYRCTECQAEYQEYPEFCDCGNDTFEEVYEEDVYEEEEYYEPPKPRRRPKPKRVLSEEELEEIAEEKADKQKALIVMAVSLVISIVVLFCPPYPKKKSVIAQEKAVAAGVTLPDVNSYWDDSLPAAFRKGDPDANLPLLNANFGSISNQLRTYLIDVGEEFSSQWNPNVVVGSGECKVQFIINRDGIIDRQKMVTKSRNETLDDSVLLLLSKIKNLEIPPSDYKGERIILAFKVDEKTGGSKVYYPTYTTAKKK